MDVRCSRDILSYNMAQALNALQSSVDKRLTAVRGKKYLQVAKNRYSGDLGIVPLDFDKDALSYQPKKKKAKVDDSDKILDQCFEEYSLEKTDYADLEKKNREMYRQKGNAQKKQEIESYLSDILNSNRTR